ncbi:CAF17-like 4Fe-4S cluster assembly/insertion protein YgfZ [Chachezhania sediminis]|uniref:CAF17-like 4Fe-4S cluster assembly/insertion protein YgfZ n=1 Tax=Chachezhania sediminis TaxID=2599291 RepID=UPI00131CDBF7|nr:folate-binding protein [Chachezhania sediminis]
MSQRSILRLSGGDVEHFLQGLVTNDVAKLSDGAVYAALLTPQGKYIADFFLIGEQDGSVLLDVAASLADDLTRRLSMYKLRADVAIAPAGLNVRRGTGPKPDGAVDDPRHPALGWRLYSDAPEGDDGTDWDALRVAHCIPETGIELTPDSYILEAGFAALNGVDFRKGCYVGQEVTARMKHKTELKKGLALVAVDGVAVPGDEILSNDKPAGQLLTRSGDRAIAYLRFDRAHGPMVAGTATVTRL